MLPYSFVIYFALLPIQLSVSYVMISCLNILRDVPPMHLCVSPWARFDAEMSARQENNSDCTECSPWIMPEVTPPEACLPRQRSSMSRNGRLQRLLSNIPGWSRRHHGSGNGEREEDSDGNNKRKKPRAFVAISVVSMYLLAAAVLGYATLRGDSTSNTGPTLT